MDNIFNRAESKTLRTEVRQMIRNAIVTGKLQPGVHLKENEISEQMGVSRSPVREAFRQLEQEGLIESIPNRGVFVKKFSSKEIEEIFTLRAVLENLAFELVIQGDKMDSEDWRHLDSYLVKQKAAMEARSFDQLTRLDMDFHEYIVHKADSTRLLKMWQSLRGQILVLFYQRFQVLDQVYETVQPDHYNILEALRSGDIDYLKDVSRKINARVAQDCIEVFQANGMA
jgi:DNA-binding GntR family transcriptional regulator